MGLWDRFGRGADAQPACAQPPTDEQALARYRYMLRTAPPEAMERAHAEAFAALTPEQRRRVLDALKREMPESERAAATRAGDSPGALAKLAIRAEIRQPGAIERIFGGMGAPGWSSFGSGLGGGGFGTMMAGTFLASMAGTVLGSMVAQHFFQSHPEANHLFGAGSDSFFDRSDPSRLDDLDRSVQEVYGDPGADAAHDDSIIDAADDGGGFDDDGFLDT